MVGLLQQPFVLAGCAGEIAGVGEEIGQVVAGGGVGGLDGEGLLIFGDGGGPFVALLGESAEAIVRAGGVGAGVLPLNAEGRIIRVIVAAKKADAGENEGPDNREAGDGGAEPGADGAVEGDGGENRGESENRGGGVTLGIGGLLRDDVGGGKLQEREPTEPEDRGTAGVFAAGEDHYGEDDRGGACNRGQSPVEPGFEGGLVSEGHERCCCGLEAVEK